MLHTVKVNDRSVIISFHLVFKPTLSIFSSISQKYLFLFFLFQFSLLNPNARQVSDDMHPDMMYDNWGYRISVKTS